MMAMIPVKKSKDMPGAAIKKTWQDTLFASDIRAARLIPVLTYDEESQLFWMDDKSLGFGFICEPLTSSNEQIQARVNSFLNQDMPAGTTLQFLLFRSPDIQRQIGSMLTLREGAKETKHHSPLLQTAIQDRAAFLMRHTLEQLMTRTGKGQFDNGVVQDLKLLITCKLPIKEAKPTSIDIAQANLLKTRVQTSLQTVGLHPSPMTAQAYIRVMQTLLNWGEEASWRKAESGWETDKPLCEQLFDYGTDIEVKKDSLRLGGCHLKVLSAKKLPDQRYFGDAMRDIGGIFTGQKGLQENYLVAVNVCFPDAESTKSTLERKRQFAVNQAYGPLLKFVPILADKKAGFDTLYTSLNEGSKPLKVSYSVIVFAPTAERATSAAIAAKNLWQEQGITLFEDSFVQLPMWRNSLPFGTDRAAMRDLFRYKTLTSEHAAVLLPLFGEWKGTGTFHTSLLSRNGQLMSLSLHDSDYNKNAMVAAQPGSGKSFFINDLILSYLSEGAQVWVVDAGKSYEKLAHLLDGDFLEFDDSKPLCINPFELVVDYTEDEDALVDLVSTMASSKGLLNEFQSASLKQIMRVCWEEKQQTLLIDDIADACLAHEDSRVRDIGTQLHQFTRDGGYGHYVNGKNTITFEKPFTVLELDSLQSRKHLRQVALLQLIYQIQQEVYLGERGRKKIVIIDEAWDLLKEGAFATFMEHAYRKFRKYGGAIIIALQSVNDLYNNAVGKTIADCSVNKFLLGQTSEAVESLKQSKHLDLAEGGYQALKTVHTIPGVYSEIFIKSDAGIGIGRLFVTDFQKLLYSTDPRDWHAIEQEKKRGLSLPEAINSVLAQRDMAMAL